MTSIHQPVTNSVVGLPGKKKAFKGATLTNTVSNGTGRIVLG
jgi:hypothetical protein